MSAVQRPAAKWAAANPDVAGWVKEHRHTSAFAGSLIEYARRHGRLTDGQSAAVRRIIAEKREAPSVDVTRLEDAFAAAWASGLRRVRITMGDVIVKPASETSSNAGALYVTNAEGAYLGKVARGKFYRVRSCTDEQEGVITRLIQDPKAAAEAYGLESGICCLCSRELSDPESVARGIGPVCAKRFNW